MSVFVDDGVLFKILLGGASGLVSIPAEPVHTSLLWYLNLASLSHSAPPPGQTFVDPIQKLPEKHRDRFFDDLEHGNGHFVVLPEVSSGPIDALDADLFSVRASTYRSVVLQNIIINDFECQAPIDGGSVEPCYLNAYELLSLYWAWRLEVPMAFLISNLSPQLRQAAACLNVNIIEVEG